MADEHDKRFCPPDQLDMKQILLEAQYRWLRPAEICQILQNYKLFQIAPEPANKPPSGSLFLFNKKVLRYFRNDGHNWRKRGDGKTVREAHEKLKAGRVDVLHCYYAHGEQDESFQRRTYWMLEAAFSHIVLVHYLELKGSKINAHRLNETDGYPPVPETGMVERKYDMESSLSSSFERSNYQIHSQTMDKTCSNGFQVSEYEDVESAYNNQPISGTHNSVHQEEDETLNPENGSTDPYYVMPVLHPNQYYGRQVPVIPEMGLFSRGAAVPYGDHATDLWSADGKLLEDFLQIYESVPQEELKCSDQLISGEPSTMTAQEKADISELSIEPSLMTQSYPLPLERSIHLFVPRSRFSDVLAEEGLKKIDSFNRWMSKELDDDILLPQSTPGTFWTTTDGDATFQSSDPYREQDDNYMLDPLISQEQLFSITDISPSWTYAGSVIQVSITGRLLKRLKEAEVFKWSCMFGEVEVPAEVIADGVLRCCAPMHEEGRVPFYVTCSNRLACSEIREFEYRGKNSYGDGRSSDNGNTIDILNWRFAKLLCLDAPCPDDVDLPDQSENNELSRNIDSLLSEDYCGWDDLLMLAANELSPEIAKEQACQNLLKQKLCEWLIRKSAESGKGAGVLDEGGQGVLHLASALGYDWALQLTVMAGVSIDFRDANGWTALHWAASCGREGTVASLISLGASPGALTNPCSVHPSGRTPADLASQNGHKGIAGFLAESDLSVHLSLLNLHSNEGQMVDKSGVTAILMERSSTQSGDGESSSHLSIENSLSAVRNATQAAARIHQAFRMMSFQRKASRGLGNDKFGMSDESALSLIASKTFIPGKGGVPLHTAATRIQNKFRGWKGRKEFLITRKRIVTIQAHFRGHKARKNHKKIIWSVGILEKVILRWRRKRNGLRSFAPTAVAGASDAQDASKSEDDDDFLRQGRKQTEERLQKALARVKSMAQYPDARDQYSRLSKVVSEMRLSKALQEKYASSSNCIEETPDFDDLIDIEQLLEMP